MNPLRVIGLSSLIAASFLLTACEAPPESGGVPNVAASDVIESAEPIQLAEWMHDYEEALALAASENKRIVLNFTGSDWCPPCIIMQREVFDDFIFNRYARDNLILVEIDFPRNVEQPDAVVEQNTALAEKYRAFSFPTFILLDSAGKELRRHEGHLPGGTRAFVRWVEG